MYKERINELMSLLKISKAEFANSIGYSTGNVSDWLNGRSKPSKKTLDDICRVFNVSKKWLETGEGEPFLSNSEHKPNRINELITLLNIKKSDFAAKINVSAGNVSNWINGISNPSKKAVDSICATFFVSKDWLLNGVGSPFITGNSFVNEKYSLSVDEEAIIDNYRQLSRERQKELYFIATKMVVEDKEQKKQDLNKGKLYHSDTENNNLNIG